MTVGHTAAEWRAMTPDDWVLRVTIWNEADGGDTVEPPTREQFEELVANYG